MRLLVDTHVLIWMIRSDRRLSTRAIEAVVDPDNEVYFSVVSAWEIAIKQNKPDFWIGEPFDQAFARTGWSKLDLAFDEPALVPKLPDIHRDPFDRMLIAQAQAHSLTMVTRDSKIRQYPLALYW